MRVFLSTVGSRGDVEPYVALAKGLRAAGHDVVLSTARRFESLAAAHGVPFVPTTDALLDLMDLPAVRDGLETLTSLAQVVRQMPRLTRLAGAVQADLIDDTWSAAQNAAPDLVVYHPKAFWGPSFAAALGARAVCGALQPFYVPTADRPLPGVPALPIPGYNRATYQVVRAGLWASVRRYLADWRRQTGAEIPTEPVPTVHGVSRHVVPQPADWPDWATTSGYWFLDKDAALAPDLRAFLDAGEPPVYVGFGSMSGRDPAGTTSLVVEAVRAAGVRAVLATGWDGLTAGAVGDDVFVVAGAPHEALFPRCAAVVHHGGAGTTAAGLRAGRPTVVVAHFGDQPFWGRRVHALGAGPEPLLKKGLTAPALMGALGEALASETIRQRAAGVGAAIRAEHGVAEAVRVIETRA